VCLLRPDETVPLSDKGWRFDREPMLCGECEGCPLWMDWHREEGRSRHTLGNGWKFIERQKNSKTLQ